MSLGDRGQLQRVAAYGVAIRDGSILLSRYNSGTWTLPGGGVEHGEHPEAAVVREVFEESGYQARVDALLGVDSAHWLTDDHVSVHSVNVVYAVEVTGGSLRPETNGTSDMAEWVTIEDLADLRHTAIVDHALSWLREGESGRYRSSCDVVRAGLRPLQDHETQLAGLRAALVAGEGSGTPEVFDFDVFVRSKKQ